MQACWRRFGRRQDMGVLMKGIDVANVMKEKLICESEM